MKVSKRIKAIASLVDKEATVLDVGTDHGYLPVHLVNEKIVKKAYASDVSENALNCAKENIKNSGLNIKTILSDGLKEIDCKFDTLVITGMGFNTIKSCLESGVLPNCIILQSNSDHYLLRKYMMKRGYFIKKEITLLDKNIYYVIIKYVKGKEILSKKYLLFGKSGNFDYYKYLLEKNFVLLQSVPFKNKIKFLRYEYYLKRLLKKYRI